ncbi:MAG: VPS10 domain-containing protein [Chloroflexota bacterium]
MSDPTVHPELYGAMRFRCIGPHRGGRVVAVSGDPVNRNTFYFGSTGGGVWKTEDGGKSWQNVSDGYFNYASVGALNVAPSDPNVIYAGMGETSIRGNVSRGDGVYKSTDAGKTWEHMGLADTRNIGEVLIHPDNPDVVYVAALGHVWGPNPERGVYRSKDGGKNWDLVLYKSEKAGAVDLSMDPNNPRIIYATIWEASRGPHFLSSGGEDSGLWRTFDGGDTWEEISRNPGLPGEGVLGKIGVAASGPQPGRVYALVEHENGALFRSDDYGDTWKRMSEDRNLRQRAWYYHHIFACPKDPNTVWVLNVNMMKSIDAGATFNSVAVQHGDTHDLWIDPKDPDRMILGDDGGAEISFEGGANWSPIENQPTAEFYHVTVDNRTPYRVFGAQQDNTTMSVPSRSNTGAITRHEYEEIGGGECGYIAVKPDEPDIIFAGNYGGLLTRYDRRTRLSKIVNVWPEMTLGSASEAMKYRFQWTSPTVFSPHNPDVLYHGGNHVFRSTNQGHSWEEISGDLTRADPETLVASGGPITKDNTGAETYATVFAIAESPVEQGVIWSGSDDGLIYLSRDNGESWENVSPGPDVLPEWGLISIIEPSQHEAGVAYVAATRYKSHDETPYLLKTDDYGASWRTITNGIGDNDFTRVIRQDPEVANLLFAGTERGIYVSFDGGENWQPLKLNLPLVPIHDLIITQGDLVVGTHGRSFWILDDITPLRKIAQGEIGEGATLHQPGPTRRWAAARGFNRPPSPGLNFFRSAGLVTSFKYEKKPDGEDERTWLDAGENPPDGVVIQYYLPEKPDGEVKLTVRDASGNEIRSFSSVKPKDEDYKDKPGLTKPKPIPAEQGANRFVWDFRYPRAVEVPDDTGSMGFAGGINTGPKAPPGTYQVDLEFDGQTLSQRFEVLPDPRTDASQEDYQEQFDLAMKVRDKLSELHTGVNQMRKIRKQIDSWIERLDDDEIKSAGEEVKEKMREVEDVLIQWRAKAIQDTLNFPVLINGKLAWLIGTIESAEGKPTQQSYDVFEHLSGIVDEELGKLNEIVEKDVAAFNEKVTAANAQAVVV